MEHRSLSPDFIFSDDDHIGGNKRTRESTSDVAPQKLRKEEQMGVPVNCSYSELSIYLQALAEGFLPTFCSDTSQYAQSRLMSIASKSYQRGKQTVLFHGFPSLQMSRYLMDDRGAELLMSFVEDFRARPIHPQLRARTLQTISGRKCDGSWQMSLPGTYLPRTSHEKPLTQRQTTSRRWVTKPDALSFPRKTWVEITFGPDVGYLHTPTTRGNYCATSMQKWPACKAFFRVFGKVTPESQEWLMGWPIGWTGLQPLGTGRFQRWRSAHYSRCATREAA